jgi:hypothetical protein
MDELGVCSVFGQGVLVGEAFIDTGPTDWNDPIKKPSVTWVPVATDIHGWSPFVVAHPACWAREHSIEDLVLHVDESHRQLRAELRG